MTTSIPEGAARRPRTAAGLLPGAFVAAASLLSIGCNNVTLTGGPNPAAFGQAVTFTATVSGSASPPSGTITFKDNNVPLASAVPLTPISATASAASFITSSLAAGTHPIVAHYSGDSNNAAVDSAPLAEMVTAPAASFYGLGGPCRLLDTRQPAGTYGGPSLTPAADRTFVARGQCGVPAGATSITINVAVTSATAAGDLRLFPAGTAPPNTSTINYGAGRTRADNALVTLGTNGAFTVKTDQGSGSVDVIVDISGYFQ
jgi:hypothetical protein